MNVAQILQDLRGKVCYILVLIFSPAWLFIVVEDIPAINDTPSRMLLYSEDISDCSRVRLRLQC